ncbi:MAG: hypothetical protein HGA31_03570 [Candidatus Moranbacteria bacterium]|nr:hypothetical protein [Candidatus Moranbacteria bacterium]
MSSLGTYVEIDKRGNSKKLAFLVEPHAEYVLPEESALSYAHHYTDMPARNQKEYGDKQPMRVKYRKAEGYIFFESIVGEPRFSAVIQSTDVSDLIALRRYLFAKYTDEGSVELTSLSEEGGIVETILSGLGEIISGAIVEATELTLNMIDAAKIFLSPITQEA